MTAVVIDASVFLAWSLGDEEEAMAEDAMRRVVADGGVVPRIWWYEVRNALVMNERRGRISPQQLSDTLADSTALGIAIDDEHDASLLLDLARHHDLTVYDAAYLEVAVRRSLPLATLDRRLQRAVDIIGINPFPRHRTPYGHLMEERAVYDVSNLKTPEECRTVMERAQARGLEDVYKLVFRRYCDLVGSAYDDPFDPLIREFHETLAAYEQLLTEKNGRTTKASRARQKVANKGVHQSLIEWTLEKVETDGFKLLIEKDLPQYTGEYLVVKYANRFTPDVVQLAKARLEKYGVEEPK